MNAARMDFMFYLGGSIAWAYDIDGRRAFKAPRDMLHDLYHALYCDLAFLGCLMRKNKIPVTS